MASLPLLLYAGLGGLARPGLALLLSRRAARGKEDASRLAERRGISGLGRPPGRLAWLHAASVGETMSVLPVIALLAPRITVLLTTGTVTSASLAQTRLPPGAIHQYAPLDAAPWVARFLDHWRPDVAAFVESEIWPGMLAGLDRMVTPRLLLNARMSARSAARWQHLGVLARPLFRFAAIHAQSAADAAALAGLSRAAVLDWGNLKYAAPPLPVDEAALATLRASLPGPVWLATSTHPGEDEAVIAAHRALAPTLSGLVTVIAPRHPARGGEIAALASGLAVGMRSAGDPPPPGGGIYVADTLGELGLWYRLAPFAFVGGSLVPHGGQNVVEPARLGRAMLLGPHTANFAAPVAAWRAAGAARRVAGGDARAAAAAAWLAAPDEAARRGAAGAELFDGYEALPDRLAALILRHAG